MIPFGGTFLVFSDYNRPAIRLAALSEFGSIFVYTHDSIGLGEDGPTHQPIEHLMALRAIPELLVVRPADANETAAGMAVRDRAPDGPTLLAFSRQAVPHLARTAEWRPRDRSAARYVVSEADGGSPEAIIIATGTEVEPRRRGAGAAPPARRARARRQHALLGAVRGAGPGVSRGGAAARRARASRWKRA